MTEYDLCLAWNIPDDQDFAAILGRTSRERGLSYLKITSENFETVRTGLEAGELTLRAFLDRASDNDTRFELFSQWALKNSAFVINKPEHVTRAIDKAAMHFDLINAGVQTPYTILLPAYNQQPQLPPIELGPLGDRFIIKPAHGGGGEGVVREAKTWEKALEVRQAIPDDTYLLQVFIEARRLDSREAWFRVLHCSGESFPCWWDTTTHVYTPVSAEDEKTYNLQPLRQITATIAQVCKLELFSTEIALTPSDIMIDVDYVNDQIDLRLQSRAEDGIPDAIVEAIATRLTLLVAANVPSTPS